MREKEREPRFAATAPPPEFRTRTGNPKALADRSAAAKPGSLVSGRVAPT